MCWRSSGSHAALTERLGPSTERPAPPPCTHDSITASTLLVSASLRRPVGIRRRPARSSAMVAEVIATSPVSDVSQSTSRSSGDGQNSSAMTFAPRTISRSPLTARRHRASGSAGSGCHPLPEPQPAELLRYGACALRRCEMARTSASMDRPCSFARAAGHCFTASSRPRTMMEDIDDHPPLRSHMMASRTCSSGSAPQHYLSPEGTSAVKPASMTLDDEPERHHVL